MFFSCVFLFAFRVGVLFGPEAPKSNVPYSCKNALQTLVAILENVGWRNVATHQTRHGNKKKTTGNTKNTFSRNSEKEHEKNQEKNKNTEQDKNGKNARSN